MVYRIAIVLVGLAFVAYRLSLWVAVWRAHRAGDRAREERLRTRGFGLYRWAAAGAVILVIVLALLVWSNSR
ncbi:MAG TPA: hypothetical protein VFQ01_13440 [Nocardioides sp.]|jgi:hypothetical protein|nr:hypothetical protein [Nocardioides sp.]